MLNDLIHDRPEPFKFINFPSVEEAGLKIAPGSDGESIVLTAQKPIKGIILDIDGDAIRWSDQAIDLIPGDPQIVKAPGLNGRTVKARYLGDGTA
jgi:beta-mannosidase